MPFFDDLGDMIINKSKVVANKAKDVADFTKMKTEIVTEENKIKSVYAEIGKLYYERAHGEIDPEFQPLFEKVAASRAAVAENRAVIQKMKGVGICPECGAEISSTAQFCSSCGAPIPQRKEDPFDDDVFDNEKKKDEDFPGM